MKITDKQFSRMLKLMELNKTPERKKFEEEYSCYIFSLRPSSIITPDTKIKWSIDTWYKVQKDQYGQDLILHPFIWFGFQKNSIHLIQTKLKNLNYFMI